MSRYFAIIGRPGSESREKYRGAVSTQISFLLIIASHGCLPGKTSPGTWPIRSVEVGWVKLIFFASRDCVIREKYEYRKYDWRNPNNMTYS